MSTIVERFEKIKSNIASLEIKRYMYRALDVVTPIMGATENL